MLKAKQDMTIQGLFKMHKYKANDIIEVYTNGRGEIFRIAQFTKLNGGKKLSKSQMRLLGLKKIKLNRAQATNGIIKTICKAYEQASENKN